ncbi:MAG: cytochrome c [Verrucomicrobia bacterium]|nr:cytochrome c [Verrucomicrobiota bacterium]
MNDSQRPNDRQRRPRASNNAGSEGFSDGRLVEVHNQLALDKEEPSEGFALLPVIIVFLFCGFGFWAGLYLTRNADSFNPGSFDLDAPRALADNGPREFEPDPVKGEKLFVMNCASCHQATGLGLPGAFPPLAGSPWVAGNEDRMIKIIIGGLAGELEVKGAKYIGAMPNIGANLKDAQVAHIATYVRQAWGNTAGPVTDAKVAEIRKAMGVHGSYSPAEILQAHPLETK